MRPTNPLLATALATLALSPPALAHDDPRPLHHRQTPSQDLRSPDTRDAAEGRTTASVWPALPQDLRSPDAQDAADGRGTAFAPAPAITVTRTAGFKWGDAAIGAGGATGVVAITLAGGIALRHRRSSSRRVIAL
jgi:hypothetical protein